MNRTDVIKTGSTIIMYQYAVTTPNQGDREYIFKTINEIEPGLLQYDNSSHDGNPFYTKPVFLGTADNGFKWLNQKGELVSEMPFVLDENGKILKSNQRNK